MAAHGVTSTVIQHTADHQDVCRRHHRWLAAVQQYPLDHLPEVLTANRRHRDLARRADPRLAGAYRDARTAVTTWFTAGDRPDLHGRWIRRLDTLPEDPYSHPGHPDPQRIALAIYPEAVDLAADHLASGVELRRPARP